VDMQFAPCQTEASGHVSSLARKAKLFTKFNFLPGKKCRGE